MHITDVQHLPSPPTLSFYDARPGGTGASRAVFDAIARVLAAAETIVRTCGCDTGCIACVLDPRCKESNAAVCKQAAGAILTAIVTEPRHEEEEGGGEEVRGWGQGE